MTRIPYADIPNSSQKIQDFFEKMGGAEAEIQNIFKMVAHSEASVREFIRLGNRLLVRAHLDAKFRELAILRIAQLIGAKYEWAHHVTIGISSGLSKEQIKELDNWSNSSLFSDEDKTVLQFTEEVVRDSQPSEDTFETASKFLDHASFAELTISIGYWSMVGKFLKTFRVGVEEEFLSANAELFDYTGMVEY